MSFGGYKLVKFSWQGGLSGSDVENTQQVLHGFCSSIVNANLGWKWDTDFTETLF